MPISRKGKVILVLAAFLIALIPKHTIAGKKASKIKKRYHKVVHHRGDRIGKLDCASGEIAKFAGSKWICAPDDNWDTLLDLNCVSGEIAKFDDSEWICAPDENTDTVGELYCAPDEIAKFDGSQWICAPDDNSDTLGELSCSDGQVAKYDEISNEWACADVGDGPQSCPDGFVAVNDKVCIEEFDRGPSNWFGANRTCISSNARLCTPGEWIFACQVGVLDSYNPSRFEWTDDVSDPGGYMTILELRDCGAALRGTSVNFAQATFRCCWDK